MSRNARLMLQDEAKRLLWWDKVKECYRVPKKGINRVVFTKKETGKVSASGLARCGSVWVCPVCSHIISNKRRDELQDAISRAKKLGLNIGFLTLTVRHNKGELARDLMEKISKARRLMYNRKPWKRICKELGVVGNIRALEVNYSFKNGWHIHTHELIFYKGSEIEYQKREDVDISALMMMKERKEFESINKQAFQSRIALEWVSACESAGLQLPDNHGVTLQPGHLAGRYASKWGLAEEFTAQEIKNKNNGAWVDTKKGVTPWGLLALSKEGNKEAENRFVEYADTFKGRRQLVWSKGLDTLLDVVPIAEDQLILDLEEKQPAEVLGSLDIWDWDAICMKKARGEFLDIAEQLGWSGVEAYLLKYFPNSWYVAAYEKRRQEEEDEQERAAIMAVEDDFYQGAEAIHARYQNKLAI